MAGCPQCGKHWPDDYSRCPDDGAALRESAVGATSAAITGAAVPALAQKFDDELPPGSLAGEYKIEKKIGEGGMGTVYGARHPVIGKRAAIKVIRRELSRSPEAVDRFVLEAQSVNQIGHPNIVDVFGFGQLPDGRSFFVMEWLEGESLRERLQRPLSFPEALEILEQIAKALRAAHEAGVVHRDLKPDNVYLHARKGEKPAVKLLDFGLAKLTNVNDTARFDRTRTGMVMGTPLYLSPEQAKGTKIDQATDVYSLGAMAYEMFSGHVPFKADSAVEIMAMHISAPPSPLSTTAPWVPPDVNQLVLSMLEKDARKRPSISQVREDLVTLFGSAAGRTTPLPHGMMPRNRASTPSLAQTEPSVTPPPSIAPSSGSKRGLVVGGAVVAALAIGGGLLLALNKKSAPAAAKEQPAQGSNVEVATKAPTPLPSPPDPTPPPTAGSDQGETPEVAAPPAAVPAKATGRVSITFSGPPSARVFIDGRAMGKETAGKVSFAVAAGEHTVRVQAKGFKAEEQKVRVGAGGNETVKLTLEKKRTVNSVEDPFAD